MSIVGRWTFRVEGATKDGSLWDETEQWQLVELSSNAAQLTTQGLQLQKNGWAKVRPKENVTINIKEKTLISWVIMNDLTDKRPSGSALTLDAINRDEFDGIVFGERQDDTWEAGSSNFSRTPAPNTQNPTDEQTGKLVKMAITYKDAGSGDAEIKIYCDDQLKRTYKKGKIASWSANDMEVIFGARHTLGTQPKGYLNATIVAAEIHDECLSNDAIADRHHDFSHLDYHYYSHSITDLKILEGTNEEPDYQKGSVDLNKGTSGKPLYLAIKKDEKQQDPRNWVTRLNIIGKDDETPQGWIKDPTDLNLGTNKNPLYLVYEKGGVGRHPIKDIQIVEELYGAEQKMKAGYRYINRDLNQGVGGSWLYLTYTKNVSIVTDVMIIEGKNPSPPTGYEMVLVDLNTGTSGSSMWLAFRSNPEQQTADKWITGLNVIEGASSTPPDGWEKYPTNLNKGTNGKELYLIYKKGQGNPIKDIRVIDSYTPDKHKPTGYKLIRQDLNAGAGGHWLYFAYRQDDQHELSVDLIGQQTGMWCWATSGEMIMNYHGHDVAQCKQASHRFGKQCCDNWNDCITGGWPQFENWGFSFQKTNSQALSFDQLKAQIDGNKPIAFSWAWSGSGGHMMVVIGYKKGDQAVPDMVCINDPWPPYVGDYTIIPYTEFVSKAGQYTHWDDFYDITYKTATPNESNGASANENGDAMTSGIDNTGNPPPTYADAEAAAMAGLQMLPNLVTPENFAKLGLRANIADASGLSLGEPIPIQYIWPNDLNQFESGHDIHRVLGTAEEFIYPVIEGNTIIVSIVVTQENGRFRFSSIGKNNLINAIHHVYRQHREETGKDHESYFLIHIPHVYHKFLAHYEGDTLMITTIFPIEEHGIPVGATMPAYELIALLLPSIQGNDGALVPPDSLA